MNNNTKKILIICPYPQNVAPSQRLKYEQYFEYFEQQGYLITVKPFISKPLWKILYIKGFWFKKFFYTFQGYLKRFLLLFHIRSYDIVYIHLWVTPFGFPIFEFLVKLLSRKMIYDIDDMIFLKNTSYANKPMKFLKSKSKIYFLTKYANHVITSTPALSEFAKQYNSNVDEIPATINTNFYIPKINYRINDTLILGYSCSHSTSKYLKELEPVFIKLLTTNIKFKVLVIGDIYFKFNNQDIPLETIEWNIENEKKYLSIMDIGLYPLNNEPWVFGKRGGKILLYMANGLPIIATAIGTNLQTFENYKDAILIPYQNNDEWFNAILLLYQNQELREFLGKNARKKVESLYSTNINYKRYLKILNSL